MYGLKAIPFRDGFFSQPVKRPQIIVEPYGPTKAGPNAGQPEMTRSK